MNNYKFFSTLFNLDEQVCLTKSVYGTDACPIIELSFKDFIPNFFCINPLNGTRKDVNITVYRNILIEFDGISLKEQEAVIANIPYTSIVYSGGKSYHAIISLQTPCLTRQTYDALVSRILNKLPLADKSTKNPSRLSRTPNAIRNGIKQELVALQNRVSDSELLEWLGPEPVITKSEELDVHIPRDKRLLRGSTLYFLGFGAPEGEWNRQLFLAALDLSRCTYTEEEVFDRLNQITGHLDKRDISTIKSAIRTAGKEQL